MKSPISTIVAIVIGVIILAGYFIPPEITIFYNLHILLLGWAVILAGVALLVGIVNMVFGVHWKRVRAQQGKDYYSPFLILAFIITAGVGFIFGGPNNIQFQRIVAYIQVPIETSLMGVLAITLAFAAARLFQMRKGLMGWVFIASALIFFAAGSVVLLGAGNIPFLQTFLEILPSAGARGLLIGIALGSLTAGLRIILGADRPYSG
ncbi:MAG: hypothetical protein HGA53_04440 [Anaerolineaceae bacterium]|nr:hypothetical protein [Anaerolineaceae bacterium]